MARDIFKYYLPETASGFLNYMDRKELLHYVVKSGIAFLNMEMRKTHEKINILFQKINVKYDSLHIRKHYSFKQTKIKFSTK